MFVGHLALAFAAKPRLPAVSLGWLIAAVSALDLLWPLLLIAGIEHVRIQPGATPFTPLVFTAYPWSHSLLTAIGWGIAFAALASVRGLPRSAFAWLAALVVSHWVLDWISHVPDMPLWPTASSPRLGLGLWNSIPATIVVEGLMWIAGLAIHLRHRRATSCDRPGRVVVVRGRQHADVDQRAVVAATADGGRPGLVRAHRLARAAVGGARRSPLRAGGFAVSARAARSVCAALMVTLAASTALAGDRRPLAGPLALAVDGDVAYVVDTGRRVIRLDLVSRRQTTVATSEPLRAPFDIDVAPDHALLVQDQGRVVRISPSDGSMTVLADGEPAGPAASPFVDFTMQIASDPRGGVFVAHGDRIEHLASEGTRREVVGAAAVSRTSSTSPPTATGISSSPPPTATPPVSGSDASMRPPAP